MSQPVVHGVPDKLITVPYHVAYAEWLTPMAADLRAAAKLSPDAAFARYLNLRADALLSDDLYASDLAWLDLKDPKIDLIFAPYETYLDGVLGVKTSYGAAILIRNDAESKKLAMYQQHEAEMQQALPIAAENKPSKVGQATPMDAARGGPALWISGGRGQSAQRSAGPCGEGFEEDFLQELYGCQGGECCSTDCAQAADAGAGGRCERGGLCDRRDSA
jgi:hypothetical protein